MEENTALYEELVKLRQHIKDSSEKGRIPVVCNDETLKSIAALVPLKVSDFERIPGIGKSFIDNYAEQFIRVINRYERTVQGSGFTKVSINKSVLETLKELEKKLVNISRRNPLLFLTKLYSKSAVDLYSPDHDPMDIIFGAGRKIEVANIKDEEKFKKLTTLLRASNRVLRDKGQNNLFIAYPFVKGKLPGEEFEIRAPLALFPVIEDRSPTSIKLSLDKNRDIFYNTTLILAYFKTNGVNKALPAAEIDEIDRTTFFADIQKFFHAADLEIKENADEELLHKFVDYTSDTFPKFSPGELYLENSLVIGNFPICSSSIQKDFQKIADEGNINTLLNDLLNEKIEGVPESEKIADPEIFENNLRYINDLNSSQEKVLNMINVKDELVIEGPPGTGKSQTITSLISHAASAGKTVLMVSEKKTALDVVYSRLGDLSKFALLIDDVNNKNLFYDQMQRLINTPPFTDSMKESSNLISAEIDGECENFEKIADELYTKDEFGIEPYKLYSLCPRRDYTNQDELAKDEKLKQYIHSDLLSADFKTVEKCRDTFRDETILQKTDAFTQLDKTFPWLSKMNPAITDFEIQHLRTKWQSLFERVVEFRKKNFFAKLFDSSHTKKDVKNFARECFTNVGKDTISVLMNSPEDFTEGSEHYTEYYGLLPSYQSLSGEEKSYFNAMQNLRRDYDNSLQKTSDEIFTFILRHHLMNFETKHRDTLLKVERFTATLKRISDGIDKKEQLTKKLLESKLSESLDVLNQSKRKSDVLRAIESKRKMSVNKFVSKFDFELFKAVKIWLLTPEVVSEIIPLQIGVFDLLIFDEASQMYVEKGIPSILRAKKVVIAGDQKQLRPSSLGTGRISIDEDDLAEDEEIAAALEEESLLDLAKYKYDDTLLNFHYRSKYEELIAFSNYAFYGGKLFVSPDVSTSERPPIIVHRMQNAIWDKRQNLVEAQEVVSQLKEIFATREENETIGIITFNSSQRDLIEDLIDRECRNDSEFASQVLSESSRVENGEDVGLFVKNIENVQGDERDIIIFSIGYAENEKGKFVQNFGWLNQAGGENRLNVAISRAKKQVHIVVSFDPSALKVEGLKNPGPFILKKYLEYASAVSDGRQSLAMDILHSFSDEEAASESEQKTSSVLTEELENKLREENIDFDRNVGIGGYSIDFALKKNGRYVIGLECDGRLYAKKSSVRERDLHRQKFLENRGWKIFRIWSSAWWKNPDEELSKILDMYDTL
jgi:very-short-patch-repair endonuclease